MSTIKSGINNTPHSFYTFPKNKKAFLFKYINSQILWFLHAREVHLLCHCGLVISFAGVKNVEVDLSNQVVRILGSTPVKNMTDALEQTGRKARLIGQGVPEG